MTSALASAGAGRAALGAPTLVTLLLPPVLCSGGHTWDG